MMMNLFSTFDPSTGMMSLNWISSTLFLVLINYSFWAVKNNFSCLMEKISLSLEKELFMIMPYSGSTLIYMSLFFMIMFNNTTGLLPYIFTSPSHLVFSLSLALPLWVTLMTYGWMKKYNKMFVHLVPLGTPTILMPFMIIIETISNLIRPSSLAVRLTANMIAGHLIMSLLGSDLSTIMMIMLISIFMILMMFELAVAIIQSYVFMTLMTLYSSEI
uniref:ATP synthase subunit a n=1 Tax=Stictocephala bisonia TaxID=1585304 RepID=A0A894JM41_9HEMI|nr:ATP synthase F0 subunit 6 [Stictocephala bisonia]QRV59921.1 ATP synthase F0 subunit 6 [Stictocephala bisonia]